MKVNETEMKLFSLSVCSCCFFFEVRARVFWQPLDLTDFYFYYLHAGKTAVFLANTRRMSCRLSVGDTN